jgi:RHS repeat-associated protein
MGDFGLMFYNARWYEPAVGRFAQADTIVPQQQGVQAWDRYAYTNNDPVRYVDPNGHEINPPNCIICNIIWLNYSGVPGLANNMVDGFTWTACLLIGCRVDTQKDIIRGPTQAAWMQAGYLGMVSPIDLPSSGAGIPRGFSSAEEFQAFSNTVENGLADAGFTDVTVAFQGSSVTGVSHKTGQPFDVGRMSDFDIALASPSLLAKAKELGIPLRSGGTRTGPLNSEQLAQLGLSDLVAQLSQEAGRTVNFMVFNTLENVIKKGPSIYVQPY